MSSPTPNLGRLITDGDRRRDAVHVAVAPVTAAVDEAVRIVRDLVREAEAGTGTEAVAGGVSEGG